MVVVRISAVSYNIIDSETAIFLAQIKLCLAAIMGRWRQVRDMGTPLTPQNISYVSLLNDRWGPLKQWIGLLTAPHTHTPVQAGPTGSSKFGGSEAGFGLVWPANRCVKHCRPPQIPPYMSQMDGQSLLRWWLSVFRPSHTILLARQWHFWLKYRHGPYSGLRDGNFGNFHKLRLYVDLIGTRFICWTATHFARGLL